MKIADALKGTPVGAVEPVEPAGPVVDEALVTRLEAEKAEAIASEDFTLAKQLKVS